MSSLIVTIAVWVLAVIGVIILVLVAYCAWFLLQFDIEEP